MALCCGKTNEVSYKMADFRRDVRDEDGPLGDRLIQRPDKEGIATPTTHLLYLHSTFGWNLDLTKKPLAAARPV